MSLFLKLLGKEEIKYFRTEKQCFNPPKKKPNKSEIFTHRITQKNHKKKIRKTNTERSKLNG